MNKPIASVARTREILKTYDLRARKGYGQNFLVDVSVVARCAEAAHAEQAVIEIGPGIGALTEQLALRSAHVRAYEVDERLLPVLRDTLQDYPNVEIILQDFLTCDIAASVRELKEQYGGVSVAANLPYYITTPVLFSLFAQGRDIEWITVMVQKEVADRFAAPVNSPDYGTLSVESQYLYEVERLFNVPRTAFNPAPKVDSAIVRFHRRPQTPQDEELTAYFDLVKACFKQRRKTICNNMKEYLQDAQQAEQVLQSAGIDPGQRAQECAPEQFAVLLKEIRG